MKYLIITAAVLLIAASASPRELTLEQALQLAEEHSFSQRVARAKTLGAEQSVRAARAERLPTLSASASAMYVDEVPSLDLQIAPGMSISREIGTNDKYQTDLTLSMPLFTGGRISSGIDLANAGRDYQEANERTDLNALRYRTRQEYLALCRTLALQDAAEASAKRTAIIESDVDSRYDAGVADSVDLLEASLATTRAQFAVNRAAIEVRQAEIKLLTRLGLSLTEELSLTSRTPEPTKPTVTNVNPSARPELDAARAGIGISAAQLDLEKAAVFPTLSVFSGYSYGRPNINMFSNEFNDDLTVGARLNWSLNLGNKTGKRKRSATYQLDAARSQLDYVEEQFTQEANLALEQWKLAYDRFASAREEYRLASLNYRLAENSHRQGNLSANRLLEIETSLTESENGLAAARVDYYIAQGAFFYAVGSDNLGKGL